MKITIEQLEKNKIIGKDFLESHPNAEKRLNVGGYHVIVDRDEWINVVNYFNQHPNEIEKLGKPMFNMGQPTITESPLKCKLITANHVIDLEEDVNKFLTKNVNIDIVSYETNVGDIYWKNPRGDDHNMMVTIIYKNK